MGHFFAERPEINSFIYGATDEDIRAKVDALKQSQYPVLVGILPSIMGTGDNMDQAGYESPLFYYCMVPKANMSELDTDDAWDKTIDAVKGIEQTIREYANDPRWREFYYIKPNTIHIDPEYDMWELMGWSIRFEMQYAD